MHLTSGISWCIHILIFPILTRTKATKNKKNNNNLYIDTRNESFPFLLSPIAGILHTTHTLTHSHAHIHKYIRFVLAVAVEMLRIVGHYSEHIHTLSMDTISARGFRCDKEICSLWCIDLSSLFSLLLLFFLTLSISLRKYFIDDAYVYNSVQFDLSFLSAFSPPLVSTPLFRRLRTSVCMCVC